MKSSASILIYIVAIIEDSTIIRTINIYNYYWIFYLNTYTVYG